jgi:hypothetical protein
MVEAMEEKRKQKRLARRIGETGERIVGNSVHGGFHRTTQV